MRIAAAMPTFNQLKFIEGAVASVLPLVDKLVIVNDASTDGTREWLDALDTEDGKIVIAHHEENCGTAAGGINTGRKLFGDGFDWHTWVSSDNTYPPQWRERMLEHVGEGVGAVYSGFGYRVPGRARSYIFEPHAPGKQIKQEACYYGPSFLIRPDVWDAAGEHAGGSAHDLGHWLRLEEACEAKGLEIIGVDEDLCNYCAHDERCVLRRPDLYDAKEQLALARDRRAQ